ncbi:unknown [Gryllus bimaculatus nudivirus]|uniref:Uncharacterized protein n=1 Tax=Gryllus bimaculatus nudivirus TaxID=432587 RepID=A4L256_9VIRU|nr:hypothetical protein GrBNV_gp93 [Gryllus bimaculatus nudivirus]ABO45426.1 unknown [Gryllus bimaculatus nudivirus]
MSTSVVKWSCHLHPESKCKMSYVNDALYHIIEVDVINKYINRLYNAKHDNNEKTFWEKLNNGDLKDDHELKTTNVPVVSIYHSTEKYDLSCFKKILDIFKNLDDLKLSFKNNVTVSDIIKKHLMTDGKGFIILVNKHMLILNSKYKKRYTNPVFLKKFISTLFPYSIIPDNKSIPVGTVPDWATSILIKITKNGK